MLWFGFWPMVLFSWFTWHMELSGLVSLLLLELFTFVNWLGEIFNFFLLIVTNSHGFVSSWLFLNLYVFDVSISNIGFGKSPIDALHKIRNYTDIITSGKKNEFLAVSILENISVGIKGITRIYFVYHLSVAGNRLAFRCDRSSDTIFVIADRLRHTNGKRFLDTHLRQSLSKVIWDHNFSCRYNGRFQLIS